MSLIINVNAEIDQKLVQEVAQSMDLRVAKTGTTTLIYDSTTGENLYIALKPQFQQETKEYEFIFDWGISGKLAKKFIPEYQKRLIETKTWI